MSALSRRGFLTGLSVTAGGAALAACASPQDKGAGKMAAAAGADTRLYDAIVPFDGHRQAGISTPAQANLNLVGFNLVDGVDKGAVARLMKK